MVVVETFHYIRKKNTLSSTFFIKLQIWPFFFPTVLQTDFFRSHYNRVLRGSIVTPFAFLFFNFFWKVLNLLNLAPIGLVPSPSPPSSSNSHRHLTYTQLLLFIHSYLHVTYKLILSFPNALYSNTFTYSDFTSPFFSQVGEHGRGCPSFHSIVVKIFQFALLKTFSGSRYPSRILLRRTSFGHVVGRYIWLQKWSFKQTCNWKYVYNSFKTLNLHITRSWKWRRYALFRNIKIFFQLLLWTSWCEDYLNTLSEEEKSRW